MPAPMTTTRARSGSELMRGNPPGRTDEPSVGFGARVSRAQASEPRGTPIGPSAVTSDERRLAGGAVWAARAPNGPRAVTTDRGRTDSVARLMPRSLLGPP